MTSENELKDAAYRVKRCERGEMLIVVYDTESLPIAKIAYRDDCERLAIAYLARLAADEQRERGDAEPITEEWALQNGGGRDDGGGFAWKIWERGQGESTEEPAFHVLWSESLWLECYSATGDTLGIIELMTPPTRGQLRKLIEALKGGDA